MSPIHDGRTKTVDSGALLFEVIGEVERYLFPVDPTPFYQLERRLSLRCKPGRSRGGGASAGSQSGRGSGAPCPDAGAISWRIPPSVLRRSTTHCAVCGRAFDGWAISGAGHWPREFFYKVSTFFAAAEPMLRRVSAAPATWEAAVYG